MTTHSPLVLIGPTGAGKSTVGPLLAARLSLPFIDLDHHIEHVTARRITDLFAGDGEAAFRAIEASALQGLLAGERAVIAAGAGTVLDADTRDRLRRLACVIHLDAPVALRLGRLEESDDRPLLQGDRRAAMEAMEVERGPLYAQVGDLHLDTAGRDPADVAEAITRALPLLLSIPGTPAATRRLDVDSPRGPYPIHVGDGLIAEGSALAAALRGRHVLIVSDANVAPRFLPVLVASLRRHRPGIRISCHVLPPGEHEKTLDHWRDVIDALARMGATRDATVIALGGGVVGDLAGYAAASWMRGVDVVQVPTTLLAMVDSSVGGKTAVDLPAGKNLVGAFHPPAAVIADTRTLSTLPDRELRAGLAEVVKYGAIFDAAFLDWIQAQAAALATREPAPLAEAVVRSCHFKAAVVARDPFEQGERALLNFGHTFGHAIEAEQGYAGAHDGLVHGEAVAVGMVLAARLSARIGLAPDADATALARLLERLGLPTRLPAGLSPQALFERMRLDKKADAAGLRFILWDGTGRARIVRDVAQADVLEVLRNG